MCKKWNIQNKYIYTDFVTAAYNTIKEGSFKNYIEMKNAADKAMKEVLIHYYEVFETKSI